MNSIDNNNINSETMVNITFNDNLFPFYEFCATYFTDMHIKVLKKINDKFIQIVVHCNYNIYNEYWYDENDNIDVIDCTKFLKYPE